MNCFENLQSEIRKLKDQETERSYYPLLKDFFVIAGSELVNMSNEINVIAEASSKLHELKVGFPDLTVQYKRHFYRSLGWVEVKLPKDNLNDSRFQEQFLRYRNALENVIFTNLREWELWQWDKNGKPVQVATVLFDVVNYQSGTEKAITELLNKFYNGKALEIKTPKQLALALARKTRLLSQQVEDSVVTALENEEKENDLIRLKETFCKTLINNIEPHQFANMVAETLAYSLFLAALEHDRRVQDGTAPDNNFTLTTAIDYLPKSVPILSSLYTLTSNISKEIPEIHYAVESLIEQLNFSDIHGIHEKMLNHKQGDDPVIHFYEPFLAEYDPKEREARGVYYTPRPVVDYIVRSVDWILKEKLGKKSGIADPDVHLLDPATGTGTFLMSAIELIHEQKERQFGGMGEEMVRKDFCRTVQGHILKHFYGFELMVAPYAIAHLKLTMLLEQYGFNFDMTKDNEDKDDDRLQIYLTNSLEEPEKVDDEGNQMTMFSFVKPISAENRAASKIKSSDPVIAIIGNPPYSGISSNNGKWIRELVNDYYFVDSKPLGERNSKWLQDDYVKFIRFAQWKISQRGEGVIGLITNHSFLDNPTFRGMRQQLMKHFNEIYVFDLHGNSLRKEKTPEGGKDENVFNIQAGVAIMFLIKKTDIEGCAVYRSDLQGLRSGKKEYLERNRIDTTQWHSIDPSREFYLFRKEDEKLVAEYNKFTKITEIFKINGVGITTARDHFVIDDDKVSLFKRVQKFRDNNGTDEQLHYDSGIKVKKGWNIRKAWHRLQGITDEELMGCIQKVDYRPFDTKWIFYHDSLVWRTAKKVMKHMLNSNCALITARSNKSSEMDHFFCTEHLMETKCGERTTQSALFPLFLYENNEKVSNFSGDFNKKISQDLGLDFKFIHTFQIFDYIYGIFYLPKYRKKYVEQLKIDFPRIPLPSQLIDVGLVHFKQPKIVFNTISEFGSMLRSLHLLTHPIFDEPQKWRVKIGGVKPESVDDWKVLEVKYQPATGRVYVNSGQYFEGVEKEVWEFMVGGYQVCEKWLKDRKKAARSLSVDDLQHYLKIVVSLRETIRIMKEIDEVIPGWPLE